MNAFQLKAMIHLKEMQAAYCIGAWFAANGWFVGLNQSPSDPAIHAPSLLLQ